MIDEKEESWEMILHVMGDDITHPHHMQVPIASSVFLKGIFPDVITSMEYDENTRNNEQLPYGHMLHIFSRCHMLKGLTFIFLCLHSRSFGGKFMSYKMDHLRNLQVGGEYKQKRSHGGSLI